MVQSRFQLHMQNQCVFYTGGMKIFCFPSLYITVFPPRLDAYQASVFCFDCILRTLSGVVLPGQEMFLHCAWRLFGSLNPNYRRKGKAEQTKIVLVEYGNAIQSFHPAHVSLCHQPADASVSSENVEIRSPKLLEQRAKAAVALTMDRLSQLLVGAALDSHTEQCIAGLHTGYQNIERAFTVTRSVPFTLLVVRAFRWIKQWLFV